MANKLPASSRPKEKSLHIKAPIPAVDRIDYYVNREGYNNRTDFILDAVEAYIKKLNGDYDIPNAHIRRMNEMTAQVNLLSEEIKYLREAVNNGFSGFYDLLEEDE